jgi:tetratricopeptide (TPR) repeat protein
MRNPFFYPIISIIVLLFCCHVSVGATEALQFELTQEKIEKAWLQEVADGRFVVGIRLKEPYREYFSQLTGTNIGKRLAITFSSQILINPLIKSRIDSGVLQVGEWDTEDDARKFIDALLPKPKQETIRSSERPSTTAYQQDQKIGNRVRPEAEKFSNMALNSLGKFNLTKDPSHLIDGLALIEKAIEADHKYILGYYWKATMLTKLTEYERAILTLNEGIEKCNENEQEKIVNLYFLRGVLRHKMGKKDIAVSDYDRAIQIHRKRLEIDSKNWDATMNIAQALILMDKKDEAVKLLKETIRKYPEEESPKQILEDLQAFDVMKFFENL